MVQKKQRKGQNTTMKDEELTPEERMGFWVLEWLRTLDESRALAHIATWLEYSIYERGMDVQDTISMMSGLVLSGLARLLLQEEENDRER